MRQTKNECYTRQRMIPIARCALTLLLVGLPSVLHAQTTWNVRTFGASGSAIQSTAAAVTTSGSPIITLPAPYDFQNDQGIFIQDNGTGTSVGPNGSPFCATILAGAGTTTLLLSGAPAV